MPAIFFDDAGGLLGPLTDLRPSFAVRTGALTTRERVTRLLGLTVIGLWVRREHEAMARSRVGEVAINAEPGAQGGGNGVLLVNGRCVLPPEGVAGLRVGEWIEAEGACVAARVDAGGAGKFLRGMMACSGAAELLGVPTRSLTGAAAGMISRPWHVRSFRDSCIAADLRMLHASVDADVTAAHDGVIEFGHHPFTVHKTARIYPGVVLDHESGPIVIDEGAVIRPAATIVGPAYIGAHSTVLDRAIVKGNTAIGPHCKVAGEVGGTIFHGYANKAHDGHLGDSWVGKWANLGAGTTNSNLLNTYGEVTMRATPGSAMEKTGQQFMGAIIGDHVKTAICTRIMTGTVMGTGVMYAATAAASGTVPGFAWCTDGGQKSFRLEKFVEIGKAVMARRKVTAGEAYWARVAELHGRAG